MEAHGFANCHSTLHTGVSACRSWKRFQGFCGRLFGGLAVLCIVGLANSATAQEPGIGGIPQIADVQPAGEGLSLSWQEVTDAIQYGVRWRPVGAGDEGWTTYQGLGPDMLEFTLPPPADRKVFEPGPTASGWRLIVG